MSVLQKLVYWLIEVALFVATCWLFLLCLYPLMLIIFVKKLFIKNHDIERKDDEVTVGIFHPYCNAGAGGERVLWAAVKALQSNYKNVHVYIYTGDLDHDREMILANVEKVFDMKLQHNINIVYLRRRKWVEAKMYPFCTLFAQSFGSIWLGLEALILFKPDIYIDTMGYAFTYPIFKYIGGCKVASYTHYPIISTDMLNHVSQRSVSFNNRHIIARNPILTRMKLGYYKGIASLYGLAGRTADIVMVNSSWTKEHINSIWKCPQRTYLLYPPCDVEKLTQLQLLSDAEKNNEILIVSVSQFRPEKNHALMIEVMSKIKPLIAEEVWKKVHLVLVGSCRNEDDESYVKGLKSTAKKLDVNDNVEFKVNIPYAALISEIQKGTIGIHAMWNEHFGISVVDGLAAGLIMVANASGGPKADIIDTKDKIRNGFLAKDADEYTKIIISIINMTAEERDAIRNAARKSVNRFSTKCFENELVKIMEPFFKLKQR
ncbi:GDP-Man:Man(3)GlcNAc(2)-PP-Dol alpha-1,2-mannosyltransferase-like [Nasonia vitripennis]|uniref:GDP-Man:Man(3)GlcNAc(2)-PP-Dol alpha-1,2-mannosyltransferase n=1 Tax=Nasonia vitripennis TaxID=7425 RepID=A0A7M7R2B6_NASVI|nr:GDP-Man:Man(3)GlcNAc(2)-PP-Dol alpha-1,2-mannosyltransferase-like [Nasonia vitripennis]XP_032457382.1 GDP-Man:Man(3)GlcNAc(2)-PP-Dol alpha-1,2-mannosyltransferase-like [Nasonia vitripennis]